MRTTTVRETTPITRSLGLYAHDGTVSLVAVTDYDRGDKVWITFGEVTPDGFSPSYACILVPRTEVKGVLS